MSLVRLPIWPIASHYTALTCAGHTSIFPRTDAIRETRKHHHLHHLLEEQQSILQWPPFTTTEVFLSTHHCMTPEFPPSRPKAGVSKYFFTTYTLEKILDFSSRLRTINLQKPSAHNRNVSSTWTKRREFVLRMRKDCCGGGYQCPWVVTKRPLPPRSRRCSLLLI